MNRFILELVVIVLLPILLFSQKQNIKFEHIDGLSSNTVQCLIQDKSGFIWFGTQDGLNRYDGRRIVVFKHDLFDSTSISDSWIYCMMEDDDGYIWIGTSGGLNRFDPETETFKHWKHDPNNPKSLSADVIRSIFIDTSDKLWIGTSAGGINLFDKKNGSFRNWINDVADPNSISGNFIRSIYQDHDGVIWLGTESKGLNRVINNNGQLSFARYSPKLLLDTDFATNTIWSIFEDDKKYLWLGMDNGIARFDPQRRQIDHFYHNPHDPASLRNGRVRGFLQTEQGDLWISMFPGGVSKFNPENSNFSHYFHGENNPHSLRNDYTLDLLRDNSGLIWVATRGGASWFDAHIDMYEYWFVEGKNNRDLRGSGVRAVYEDRKGNVWIGSEGALNKYDRKTDHMSYFMNDPNIPNIMDLNIRIRAIHEDKQGYIWLGTEGNGLNRLNPKNQHTIKFLPDLKDTNSISSRYLRSIYEDVDGFLWIGTQLGGLNRYNPDNKQFKKWTHIADDSLSISNNNVQIIYGDKKGILWLGTDRGLNRYDPESDRFENWIHDSNDFESLSNDKVRSIHEDQSGILWIGTRGGFNKFDKNTGKFKRFTKKDGLLSDVVFGILEDLHGNLWLSTPKGINKFNPNNESFQAIEIPYNFQFDMGAYFKNEKGIMYFGGVEGVVAFNPEDVQQNTHMPPIMLTSFKKFDKTFKFAKAISRMKEIILSHEDSYFSFEFSALDYANPWKNQYAYRLEGFDSDWIYSGNRAFASYTNLDPGKYIFYVKGSNNAGFWNERGATIKLKITPPYWETWWFISLLIIIGVYLIISYFQFRTKSITDQNILLEKAVKEKTFEMEKLTEKIVRQEKLVTIGKISGSIAHELRNPLGAVKQAAYYLKLKHPDPNDKFIKYVDLINNELAIVDKVIDDLLEMTRVKKLKKEVINIEGLIRDTLRRCNLNENVKTIFEIDDDAKLVHADSSQLMQVILNLILNSNQAMEEKGRITFRSMRNSKFIEISVSDTGPGIPNEQIEQAFEPLYTTKAKGTGLGLSICKQIVEKHDGQIKVISKENEGTTILIFLPLEKDN